MEILETICNFTFWTLLYIVIVVGFCWFFCVFFDIWVFISSTGESFYERSQRERDEFVKRVMGSIEKNEHRRS